MRHDDQARSLPLCLAGLARETGLPMAYLRRQTALGAIPSLQVGRSPRYFLADVLEALRLLALTPREKKPRSTLRDAEESVQ